MLIWAASNLCKKEPFPELETISFASRMFCEEFKTSVTGFLNGVKSEEETLLNCSKALVAIMKHKAPKDIDMEMIPFFSIALTCKNNFILVPVTRLIGVMTSSEEYIC